MDFETACHSCQRVRTCKAVWSLSLADSSSGTAVWQQQVMSVGAGGLLCASIYKFHDNGINGLVLNTCATKYWRNGTGMQCLLG